MEKEKFNPISTPEVLECDTYQDYLELTYKLVDEGFKCEGAIPNDQLPETLKFYKRNPEIVEIRLSPAFVEPGPQNDNEGELMKTHTDVWIKKE